MTSRGHHSLTENAPLQRCENGSVLVETSIVFGLLIFLFVVVIDFCRISFQLLVCQYAVSDAARWGAVGEALPGSTLAESIQLRFEQKMQSLSVIPEPGRFRMCPLSDLNCTTNDAGAANQLYYVSYDLPIRLYGVTLPFQVKAGALARHEPY